MARVICIALGGALGSVLRYYLGGIVQRWWETRETAHYFPVGTIVINVVGCLAIGFLSALFAHVVTLREEYRVGLTVGLLGGFTTFSTFGLETQHMLRDGHGWGAAANVAVSCFLGVAAVFLGYFLAERFVGG